MHNLYPDRDILNYIHYMFRQNFLFLHLLDALRKQHHCGTKLGASTTDPTVHIVHNKVLLWLPQVGEIISRPLFLQIFVAVRLFLEPIPEMLVYTKHQNIANKPSQAGRTPGNFRVGTPGVRQRTLRPPGIKSKFSTGGGRVLKFVLKHAWD